MTPMATQTRVRLGFGVGVDEVDGKEGEDGEDEVEGEDGDVGEDGEVDKDGEDDEVGELCVDVEDGDDEGDAEGDNSGVIAPYRKHALSFPQGIIS